MARPLRIEYENAFYHITSRGNEKGEIFKEDSDYKEFINILENEITKFNVDIHSFVLMKNHYHLLIQTNKANLSNFMHNLNTTYTIYFNNKYRRIGHLFQGRYKSIVCDKESYLLELARYIHLNPVRANIVNKVIEYPYSSFNSFLNDKIYPFVKKEILEIFSNDENKARELFVEFTNGGINKKREEIFKNLNVNTILGNEGFYQKVFKIIEKEQITEEISHRKKYYTKIKPEEIIKAIEVYSNIKDKDWNKRKEYTNVRKIAIYLIKKYTDTSLKEIGNYFGISYSRTSHYFSEIEKKGEEKEKCIKEIEDKLFQNANRTRASTRPAAEYRGKT